MLEIERHILSFMAVCLRKLIACIVENLLI